MYTNCFSFSPTISSSSWVRLKNHTTSFSFSPTISSSSCCCWDRLKNVDACIHSSSVDPAPYVDLHHHRPTLTPRLEGGCLLCLQSHLVLWNLLTYFPYALTCVRRVLKAASMSLACHAKGTSPATHVCADFRPHLLENPPHYIRYLVCD